MQKGKGLLERPGISGVLAVIAAVAVAGRVNGGRIEKPSRPLSEKEFLSIIGRGCSPGGGAGTDCEHGDTTCDTAGCLGGTSTCTKVGTRCRKLITVPNPKCSQNAEGFNCVCKTLTGQTCATQYDDVSTLQQGCQDTECSTSTSCGATLNACCTYAKDTDPCEP
jgi:hypothetical protein